MDPQLLDVQPQQLEVEQLQQLVVLQAQLDVLVAPSRLLPVSAMSRTSKTSASNCTSSLLM